MRIVLTVGVILGGLTTSLAAQVHIETGGGQGHLDQLSPSSLTAFGGGAGATIGSSRIELAANAENRFGLGSTGLASGHWFYEFAAPGWHIELGPEATIAHDIAAPWSSAFSGHLAAERTVGGLSLRADWQQGVAHIGAASRSWHRPMLGADVRAGQWQLGAAWQSTSAADTNTSQGTTADSGGSAPPPRTGGYDIQDVSAHLGWRYGALSLTARAGRRFGVSVQPQTWWDGRASLRLTPLMSLTASSGRLASDLLLGLRGGQYTTLGLRLDLLQRPIVRDRAAATTPLAQVVRESADSIHLLFTMPPDTRTAAIASDLTDWHPVNLARSDDGRWEVTLVAKAGVYRVNIRTDNGPWRAPPGLPSTDDGFGAKVGLLVLSGSESRRFGGG